MNQIGRVLVIVALAAAPCRAQESLFTYDARLPLNSRVIQKTDTESFVREKIVFDGGRGSRVPALLAIPKGGPARHPLVVLLDGIGGWKERWWQPASWNRGRILIDSLLAAGFAVVMADAPASGERTFENDFVTAESFIRLLPQWRDMGIRNAIETRRLMDYASSRADIDSARIGMLGLSHGGMMTFVLSAVDPRVKVAVAGLTPMQDIPDILMPPAYAARIHVPILMMAGSKDSWYTRQQVDSALAAIGTSDKKLVWYDVGHRVPEEYAGEATRWFSRVLKR